MKWELGWKDGQNTRSAILPIEQNASNDLWTGQQFLGLYPYVADGVSNKTKKTALWVHRSKTCYIDFDAWLNGKDPVEHT